MLIAELALVLAPIPALSTAPPGEETVVRPGLGEELDDYLSRLAAFGFSGTALVASDGEVVLAKGYGLADREKGIPMRADSVISTGSITKQFTAAAILKLEMAGELSVDDPITKYFDDVPADKRGITLHHLLTHSAGFRSNYAESDFTPVGRDEYVRRALESELLFEPGTSFAYANSGYSLLGAIVEQLSGQGYEEYLAEHLFAPAGMRDTGYLLPEWAAGRIAQGYSDGGERFGTVLERPWAEDGPWWGLRANGGIHSTVWDMSRWHTALAGDAILDAGARAKLEAPHVSEGGGTHYGYGWSIEKTPRGTKLVTHNGSNGIFFADFRRYVDEDVVVYIASNAQPGASHVSVPLSRLAFGGEVPMPPAVVALGVEQLSRFTGDYSIAGGGTVHVEARGGRLELSGDDPRSFALVHRGDAAIAERYDDQVEQTRRFVEDGLAEDYEAMYEALGVTEPLERFAARQRAMMERWLSELGDLRDLAVLGRRGKRRASTWARLDFERGSRYLAFMWMRGGKVGDFRVDEGPPTLAVHPVGEDRFLAWDPRTATSFEVRFERDASGAPTALRVGEQLATRP